MKKALWAIIKTAGAAIIAIVVLSLFTLVYWYDGIHITNHTGSTDYVWRSNEYISTMTEGFTWMRMNSSGFNNADVFQQSDILFMGSSHTDDLHFARDKNAAVLVNQLTGLDTYNIGMSGHTIYRCVDNFNRALNEYHPDKYVVIETSTIELTIKEMKKVIDGTAVPIESFDSGMVYMLQQIPALKPIVNQLKEWVQIDYKNTPSVKVTVPDKEITEEYLDTLQSFLNIVRKGSLSSGITTIIYYHPAEKLLPDGSIKYKTNDKYLEAFARTCEEQGIIFVDMTGAFQEMYISDSVLAHGFLNTKVGSGHLNEFGHKAIADKLSEVILEEENKHGTN